MNEAFLSMEKLRELLPGGEAASIAAVRLERTPHRAFRFVLLDHAGNPAAIAELDESADQCLPAQPEMLSGTLRSLLPSPLFHGEFTGRPLCIRPYFGGRPLDEAGLPADRQLALAQELLAAVQAERRSHRAFDDAEFERFVARPLQHIRECPRLEAGQEAKLDGWAAAASALRGQQLDYCLHHGDFQFSNLLRADDGSAQIIDWELSQGEAPVWLDRVHLAIAHGMATNRTSYGGAAAALRKQLVTDPADAPYEFALDAMALEATSRRACFLLSVLHGMSHFVRRVPHLANPAYIEDMFAAGDAFLEL